MPYLVKNEKYFDKWSNEMAYILGFFTADGFISSSKRRQKLTIELAIRDICVLEFIKSKISPLNKIQIRTRNTNFKNEFQSCLLILTSKRMYESLTALGIKENKTGKEKFPNIPQKYYWHYLRGLLDGDGHIAVHNSYITFNITCHSKSFLNKINKIILKDKGTVYKKGKSYLLRCAKQDDVKWIKNNIYKDAEFFLKRKFDIWSNL